MTERFERLEGLFTLGSENRWANATVAVFGLGGVGGYAVEALARCGVGKLILVDSDSVKRNNINRQILALESSVGKRKTELAAARAKDINPEIVVQTHNVFYDGGTELLAGADAVIDAIDTVTAKIKLIEAARAKKIPVVSCMGTGNKLDITKLRVAEIEKTRACPLARVMRKELKERGITGVRVVYSEEEPKHLTVGEENGRHPPKSAIFVPAAAGLMLAQEVLSILGSPEE